MKTSYTLVVQVRDEQLICNFFAAGDSTARKIAGRKLKRMLAALVLDSAVGLQIDLYRGSVVWGTRISFTP